MIDTISKNLVKLKQEFRHSYSGNSQIQEVVPLTKSELFPIDQNNLNTLHMFAAKNPIYYNSYEKKINGVDCMVYEGDINKYWLNSISHGESYQPFSPTWILSAYIITSIVKELNYNEVVDVGSGDGRIGYCGKFLGLDSHAIEIDDMLVDLEKSICQSSQIDFNPICADAINFDYTNLNLHNPVFFIGGLAQMGGDVLASGIIKNLDSKLKQKTCMVFAGSYSEKYSFSDTSHAGWGKLIDINNLKIIKSVTLPTVWSFDQTVDTSYIFTEFPKYS